MDGAFDVNATVRLSGAEEATKAVVLLQEKINEAKTLAGELASLIKKMEVKVRIADDLHSFTTAQLVEELKRREGVNTTIAAPYQDVELKVNGPAIVLTVVD